MLIAYLDESGHTGLNLHDKQQPVHHLVAVVVREDRVETVNARLDRVAPGRELHGHELYSGKGDWVDVPVEKRIAAYSSALDSLEHCTAVAYASVNKVNLDRDYGHRNPPPNPHLFALQFLCEKLQKNVGDRDDPIEQRLLLVADENRQHEGDVVRLVDATQQDGGPVGDWTSLAIPTDRMIDGIYFTPSSRSRCVQLADLVAYLLNRRKRAARERHTGPAADVVKGLWEIVTPHIRTYRSEWPT